MHMRSNIHTASIMMNTDFVDLISCSPVEINPLNAELNSICHLLALLGAHPIFHISRMKVNQLFRGEYCLYFQSVHYTYFR
jgi:hypothetical protein